MRLESTNANTGSSKKKEQAGSASDTPSPSILQPGERAPDFSLKTTPDQQVALHDFLGQPVVLVFYPADWSPVCTDQLSLYNELMSEFRRFNAEIMGISVDGVWCHLAFAKDRKLTFPLMSDFEPKGKVSQAYGAYDGRVGESTRSLFVIDPQGVIAWSHLSPDGINPGADGILAALENIGSPRPGKKKVVIKR
jgi:peroxiredoxin